MRPALNLDKISFCQADEKLAMPAYRIHREAQYAPWNEATFFDCTSTPYECWVMLQDDQIVGFAILLVVLDEITLMDIAVSSVWRGQGAGKCLLGLVIKRCLQRNASSCFLEVRESNTVAQKLYFNQGFTLLERRKGYYPTSTGREDALMMSYQFNPIP